MEMKQQKIGDDEIIYFVKNNISSDPFYHGYIQYYVMFPEVQVLYIYVHPENRGKGYAKLLFRKMFENIIELMRHENVNRVEIYLDDMSDRFYTSHNIYKKMGFNYCDMDEEGPCGPEMYLTITL